jgi:hypothetical protein
MRSTESKIWEDGNIFLRLGPPDPDATRVLSDDSKIWNIFGLRKHPTNIPVVNIRAEDLFREGSQVVIDSIGIAQQVFLFEYAYGFFGTTWLKQISWSKFKCSVATIEMAGLSPSEKGEIKRYLRKAGLHQAGGGLRATGTDLLFIRPTSLEAKARVIFAQIRWLIGQAVVWVRAHLTSREVSRARWKRFTRVLDPKARKAFVLDSTYGLPVTSVSPFESLSSALTVEFNSQSEFQVSYLGDEAILAAAFKCHDRHKVWPISFSYPHSSIGPSIAPLRYVSEIIPGQPYSFNDPRDYLDQYATSCLAVTHRKAGWDCFRHVEILSSGAVPLMIDAHKIPEFSMIHYPKSELCQVRDHALVKGELPDQESRTYFSDFFNRNLTSLSMAKYLLLLAGLSQAKNVLFVDNSLPTAPDYQSVLTLIGLKQLLGSQVSLSGPVDYLYSDWEGDERSLYGRGFGYTRILDPSLRSVSEDKGNPQFQSLPFNPGSFDAVIVGSIQRNASTAREILQRSSPTQTIWIHGEDTPPSWQQTKFLTSSKTHVFVRAIH